ncbi:MAG: adenine nucleotide alpha hydrolase [Gemmataceae bacterium]|nr:adenine nucleotide alpha hydrolase [Gemmataceae bacterium]
MKPRVLLSWSSGKDSAWALHVLRQRGEVEVIGLVTTLNEAFDRVAMHGVRATLVQAQADAVGLPLWRVPLPWPCSNDGYEVGMRGVIGKAVAEGVTGFAFGDLFLEDIRAYRVRQLAGTGIEPLFPVWGTVDDTPALARAMIATGLKATLACVDPRHLPPAFAGRAFDLGLLADLPPGVDPCGENGEFHTFCHAGPVFDRPIPVRVGDVVERDGFWFADLIPGEGGTR